MQTQREEEGRRMGDEGYAKRLNPALIVIAHKKTPQKRGFQFN
jgi:hypothetical protein